MFMFYSSLCLSLSLSFFLSSLDSLQMSSLNYTGTTRLSAFLGYVVNLEWGLLIEESTSQT
jgi:hypothetical protein